MSLSADQGTETQTDVKSKAQSGGDVKQSGQHRSEQELSYRKQIARQLHTQFVFIAPAYLLALN